MREFQRVSRALSVKIAVVLFQRVVALYVPGLVCGGEMNNARRFSCLVDFRIIFAVNAHIGFVEVKALREVVSEICPQNSAV